MNEEHKPVTTSTVLIALQKEQLDLARKQLLFTKIQCGLTALLGILLLIAIILLCKYVPSITESLQHLQNLDNLNGLSEVDFNALSKAINALSTVLGNLPFSS